MTTQNTPGLDAEREAKIQELMALIKSYGGAVRHMTPEIVPALGRIESSIRSQLATTAPAKPADVPVVAIPSGTDKCPICGESGPHQHTGDEIGRQRIDEKQKSVLTNDHALYSDWLKREFSGRQPAGSWETWLAAKAIYQPKRTPLSREWYQNKISECGDADCLITPAPALSGVTDEENEKFSRDVSNFKGSDPEATKFALEQFAASRALPDALPAEPLKGLLMGPWVGPASPFAGFKLSARFETEGQALAAKDRLAATQSGVKGEK